jgi:hypothetical protein
MVDEKKFGLRSVDSFSICETLLLNDVVQFSLLPVGLAHLTSGAVAERTHRETK